MPYRIGPGDPVVSFDALEIERRAAAVFKANGVTTNAQRAAFVAGLTGPQQLAALQAILNALMLSPTD